MIPIKLALFNIIEIKGSDNMISFINAMLTKENDQTKSLDQEKYMLEMLDKVIAGDLSVRLELDPNSSCYELSKKMNTILDEYEKRMIQLSVDLTHIVSTSIDENSFINRVAEESVSIQGNLDTIVSVSEELTTSFQSVTQSNNHAIEKIEDAGLKTSSMRNEIGESVVEIADIQTKFQSLTNQVKVLNEEISSIEGMIQLISQISDQTNLLALNASIEAARAGEFGKGFAVVAQEVKKLSEQTNKSVSEIRDNVNKVQLETVKTSEEIYQLTEQLDNSNNALQECFENVNDVLHNLQSSIEEVKEVAPIIEEQTETFDEVVVTISEMNNTMVNMTKDIDRSSKNLYELGKVSEKLRGTLTTLKINYDQNDIIDLAKTDHLLWRWNVENMLAGKINLDASKVHDHTICRLGKWYFSEGQQKYSGNRTFEQINDVHEKFHQACAEVIRLYQENKQKEAFQLFPIIKQLSEQTIHLLDELKAITH